VQFGVLFPEDLRATFDPGVVRDFVQAFDGAGFRFITFPDHVVGTPPGDREVVRNAAVVRADAPPAQGNYTHERAVHEPFILSAYVFALTEQIHCFTSILILAQRQAALVAKQAAELAVISGGRFSLGVGVGYQPWEFEALGVPYEDRGARYEEQLQVIKRLWADPLVTVEGRFHALNNVGINPRPPGGHIPLWMGGGGAADPVGVRAPARRVLDRIGRHADGWIIVASSFNDFLERRDIIRKAAKDSGRDPAKIGILHEFTIGAREVGQEVAYVKRWEESGITHARLAVAPRLGSSLEARLRALSEFRRAYEDA